MGSAQASGSRRCPRFAGSSHDARCLLGHFGPAHKLLAVVVVDSESDLAWECSARPVLQLGLMYWAGDAFSCIRQARPLLGIPGAADPPHRQILRLPAELLLQAALTAAQESPCLQ